MEAAARKDEAIKAHIGTVHLEEVRKALFAHPSLHHYAYAERSNIRSSLLESL